MRNKKVILSSILSLVLCLSLLAGGTFALFTSESQSNIAVNAADVEVVATLSNFATETKLNPEFKGTTTFENNGTVNYDVVTNKLTLDAMSPGDLVKFDVNIENKSNIDVSYRVKVTYAGELGDVLEAYITLPDSTAETKTKLTSTDIATEWLNFDNGNTVTLPMSIELPYTVGNAYERKSAEIVVSVQAVQKNATDLVMLNGVKYDTINDAVAAVTTDGVIELSGNFDFPTVSMNNKNITFAVIGDSFASIDATAINHNSMSGITSGSTLTFDGVDVAFSTANEGYQGFTHITKVVYKNSTISGTQFMYGDADFINCTFKTGTSYAVYGRGEGTLTFTDCVFKTGGRAIMLYNDDAVTVNVKLTNCAFYDNGAYDEKPKAAVETGDNPKSPANTSVFNITIDNCTTEGFEINNSTSPLWGNKNNMPSDRLTVVIDGQSIDTNPTVENVATVEELQDAFAAAASQATGDIVINLTANFDVEGNWTAVDPEGYNGANNVVVNGNGYTIKGLDEPLFVGSFGGYGSITINDLTIEKATISKDGYNNLGLGAFVAYSDASGSITLNNCHLIDSTVTCTNGYAGGLIGYTSSNTTITGCSVKESTITGQKSAGAIVAHGNAAITVNNATVSNCEITENLAGRTSVGAGAIVGRMSDGCTLTLKGTITLKNTTVTQGTAVTGTPTSVYCATATPDTTEATIVTE